MPKYKEKVGNQGRNRERVFLFAHLPVSVGTGGLTKKSRGQSYQ
jgi:hypothetical protein